MQTLDDIEQMEKARNKAFRDWIESPQFKITTSIHREELALYVEALHSDIADLEAEVMRLKKEKEG